MILKTPYLRTARKNFAVHQTLGIRPGFVFEKIGVMKNDISIRNNGIAGEQRYGAQPIKGCQTENERTSIKKWRIFTRGAKAKA
jgi:hypothetical protein